MILAIDESIPYWKEAFGGSGELRPFSGRSLRMQDIRDADALVVRSITRVDAALLEGSSVRFVGTATIGMDHLDQDYLRSRDVYVTNAAGSNANAVAEYITTALLVMAARKKWDLTQKTCAINGVGHVGSMVEAKIRALGMQTLLCDPPLRESTGNSKYLFLQDVLDADILTLHVPLLTGSPYPTHHLIDQALLHKLPDGKTIINSSRGAVVQTSALKDAIKSGKLAGVMLDVWEGEPDIDYGLLNLVDIGTPHIAGFSLDGKVRATEMILEELCRFFNAKPSWDAARTYPPISTIRSASGTSGMEALRSVCLQAYNILRDDANLRALQGLSKEMSATCFDQLRNEYPLRPEFGHYAVELKPGEQELSTAYNSIGFKTRVSAEVNGGV
jgi:erythronate-4-phosphate dehydrogenase